MEQIIPCLHPNPGWDEIDPQQLPSANCSNPPSVVGKHCILELYDCNNAKLNDEAFLRTTITSAAKHAGATLLNLITHRFQPQGVTGLALLAESHISIHTWPEKGYAAVDVFTCGDQTMPENACEFLRNELESEKHSLTSFCRETPLSISADKRIPIDHLAQN